MSRSSPERDVQIAEQETLDADTVNAEAAASSTATLDDLEALNILSSHPLINVKMTELRNKATSSARFRQLIAEISLMVGIEASRCVCAIIGHDIFSGSYSHAVPRLKNKNQNARLAARSRTGDAPRWLHRLEPRPARRPRANPQGWNSNDRACVTLHCRLFHVPILLLSVLAKRLRDDAPQRALTDRLDHVFSPIRHTIFHSARLKNWTSFNHVQKQS